MIEDFDKEFYEYNSLSPKFINYQFEKSKENLGLDHIDFYSLNQPEVHLSYLSKDQFFTKLLKSFEVLEKLIEKGKLGKYGISTWRMFRVDHRDKYHVPLS